MHEMYNLNKVKFRISSLIKLDRTQYRAIYSSQIYLYYKKEDILEKHVMRHKCTS